MELVSGIGLFLGLLLLLCAGIPVAFSLGFVAIVAMYFLWGFEGLVLVAGAAYSKNTEFFIITIPLFILMGEAIAISGIGKDAFKMVDAWLGFLPGGLVIVTVGICTIFGAVSGFSPATVAAIGPVALEEARERDYDKGFMLGAVGAAAGLAIIIPPSILMVIYAFLAEVSLGKLFYAGVVPGLVISFMITVYVMLRAVFDPKAAPRSTKYLWQERLKVTFFILPFALLIFLVLGTIWGGIATPTEGAALGAAGALILPLAYGKFRHWKTLKTILIGAARINCMVMFILLGAALFTTVLAYSGFTESLVSLVVSLDMPNWLIVTAMMAAVFFLGCVMDAPSILFLTMPIFLPIAISLKFDLIWFGVLCLVNLEIATITPPVGLNLYVMKAIADDVSATEIVRSVAPYWVLLMASLLILGLFPVLSTWLPNLILGKG